MLPDHMIREAALRGELGITPYREDQLQPASYDMLLHPAIRTVPAMPHDPGMTPPLDPKSSIDLSHPFYIAASGWALMGFCLAVTQETIRVPPHMVARVEGKSSLARQGLLVHITAGFIDPGFSGPITLELACVNGRGIILYPGMPICQVSFEYLQEINGHPSSAQAPYQGKYVGSLVDGPTPSRYFMNFKEHGGRY